MSIYLALLDENPADRKQAERLLYRESNYRTELGDALYFETFGKEDVFFPFMEKYDLIFIDVHSGRDAMMVALDMIKKGCGYPVFLCSGEIDYKEKYGSDPRFAFENIHYLNKPLSAEMYRSAIDMALSYKESHVKKVELRNDKETLYVAPDEIIYVIADKGAVSVSLTSGKHFRFFGRLEDFILSLPADLTGFLYTSKDTVINMRQVVSVSGNAFKMSDGAFVKFSIFSKPGILKHWKKWTSENTDTKN